jgi:hypothetical protein
MTTKVTPDMRNRLALAIQRKGVTFVAVSNHIKAPRNFVTKFLKGDVATIDLNRIDALEDFLGTQLAPVRAASGAEVLPLAAELTQAAESDPRLGKVLEALALLASPAEPVAFIPVVHQKHLIKIGAELTRIVHRWEQAADRTGPRS